MLPDTPIRRLQRLDRLYGSPDYVKAAEQEILDPPREAKFADEGRDYPIHTKAAAWYSAARFADDDLPPSSATDAIRRNIDSAVRRHRIDADVADVRIKAAAYNGVATADLPDDDFAILYKDADGKVVGREFRMINAGEVKAAAAKLLVDRFGPPFERRREAAERILKRAATLGVDLDPEDFDRLERTSGAGLNTREEVADFMRKRASIYERLATDAAEDLRRAAAVTFDPNERYESLFLKESQLLHLARTIDLQDRELVKHGKARREDLDPVDDVLFRIQRSRIEKFAAENVDLGGTYYRRIDLNRIAVDRLRDLVGEVFIAKVASDGLFVDVDRLERTLAGTGIDGAIDRALFVKAAAAMGIEARSPVAVEPTLTKEVLRKLASRLPDGKRGPRNLDEL